MALNKRHGTKEELASFLLNESAYKQDQLGIAWDVDGMKSLTVDSGIVHVKSGLRKSSFDRGIFNKPGDTNKGGGLSEQSLSVFQKVAACTTHSKCVVARSDIKAMQRNDQWYLKLSGDGQRLYGIDGKMGVNNGWVGSAQTADEITLYRKLAIKTRYESVLEPAAIAQQDFGLRILEAWVRTAQANHKRTVATKTLRLFRDEGLAGSKESFAKD